MKKTVNTSVVGMMMAAALVAPVHAADNTTKGTMEVTYTEPNKYIVSIPSSVDLTKQSSSTITSKEINIEPGKQVEVKISNGINADGKVTLTREKAVAADTTTSTVSLTENGQAIAADAVVATFEGQITTDTPGGTLYFSALPTDLAAGTWKGQIIFSISVELIRPI